MWLVQNHEFAEFVELAMKFTICCEFVRLPVICSDFVYMSHSQFVCRTARVIVVTG